MSVQRGVNLQRKWNGNQQPSLIGHLLIFTGHLAIFVSESAPSHNHFRGRSSLCDFRHLHAAKKSKAQWSNTCDLPWFQHRNGLWEKPWFNKPPRTKNGKSLPPIRMVMTGEWFMTLFYPHYSGKSTTYAQIKNVPIHISCWLYGFVWKLMGKKWQRPKSTGLSSRSPSDASDAPIQWDFKCKNGDMI